MAKALFNDVVLAESDNTVTVEGNVYFPPDSINRALFEQSATRTMCGWKGEAHYYHINAGGEKNEDAAWYYPDPKQPARNIKGYVAFWRGVTVQP